MSVNVDKTNQALLMPKLAFRYSVYFTGFGGIPTGDNLDVTRQLVKFDRPKVSFKPIELPVYNSTIKIAGKHEWADITCEIRDDANGSVSTRIGRQLQAQLDFQEMSSASAANNYKFTTVLTVLDGSNGAAHTLGNGGVLEEWHMLGCYLKEVNYSSQAMDYAASEALKIAMTISFDNAWQAVGGPVGNESLFGRNHRTGSLSTGVAAI